MKVKVKSQLTVDLDIYADVDKGHPMSRHYPEEPASIDEVRLFHKDTEIDGALYDSIMEEHGNEIDEKVKEQLMEDIEEEAMSHAEHMKDLMEDR